MVGGIALGICLYLASSRWIRQVLYGVAASDTIAVTLAVLFIATVAFVATAPRLWRAVHMDPAASLRQD